MAARYPLVLNGTTIEELQSVDTLAGVDAFVAGTKTNFIQAAAPTGWTQCITLNNYAMRLVSGTGGGTGGSVAFTTAFASQTPSGTVSGGAVAATTLTTCQIPAHAHNIYASSCFYGSSFGNRGLFEGNAWSISGSYNTSPNITKNTYTLGGGQIIQNTGGGGSHTHTFTQPSFSGTAINLAVQYVDNIVATKN